MEITGGEIAQVGEIVAGHELGGTCDRPGRPRRDRHRRPIEPGDAVIGLPSSGLHSNGYTLARHALRDVPLDDERLGRPLARSFWSPRRSTCSRRCGAGCAADVRGLAHITGGGFNNLLRLGDHVGYEIDEPLPVPPVFDLIAELGGVDEDEMYEVFNMGCGFCCVVAAADEEAALGATARALSGRAADRTGDGAAGGGPARPDANLLPSGRFRLESSKIGR